MSPILEALSLHELGYVYSVLKNVRSVDGRWLGGSRVLGVGAACRISVLFAWSRGSAKQRVKAWRCLDVARVWLEIERMQ